MNPKQDLRPELGSRLILVSAMFLVLYFMIFALTSCSTVAGVGQDVQKVGNEIEEAAH